MESPHDSDPSPPREKGDRKEPVDSVGLAMISNWNPRPLWQRLLLALLIVAVASELRVVFFGSLGESIPYLLYFPALTLAALYGGLVAGLLATALSAGLVFFWINQGHLDPPEWLAMAVFIISGALISYICEVMHRSLKREKLAREEAETTHQQLQGEMIERQRVEVQLDFALKKSRIGAWELNLLDHTANRTLIHDQIFGYETLLPQWTYEMFLEHVHPEDRLEVDRKFREAAAARADWNFECRIRHPDGEIRWIFAAGGHELNEAGEPLRISGIVQDITERKRAEQMLSASESRYRSLFENMQEGYAYCRMFYEDGQPQDFTYLAVNRAFEQLTGLRDVVGKKVSVVIPGIRSADPELFAAYGRVARTGQPERFEVFVKALGMWFSIAVHGPEPEHFVAIFEVITERKLAEEKIKRTVADLERSNQELEHFAYVASHDLQEPLRMVASYTQLLEQHFGGQLDDKARKYIHYAVDGAVRMQTLINDLLAYSRVGRHGKSFEPTDAHAVLGMAIRNLTAAIGEAHAVITSDDLPTVTADASQLVLLFQNLLSNAIKFRRGEQPRIHVSARRDGREWRFAVKDNGIGIEAQYAERVFVIFQRLHTKEEYSGTGIGLAICKRIVERHGGRIWFESSPGSGTTFFFTIPE